MARILPPSTQLEGALHHRHLSSLARPRPAISNCLRGDKSHRRIAACAGALAPRRRRELGSSSRKLRLVAPGNTGLRSPIRAATSPLLQSVRLDAERIPQTAVADI